MRPLPTADTEVIMGCNEPTLPAKDESTGRVVSSPQRGRARTVLSVLFGIVVPLLCLKIDGCVFVTMVWDGWVTSPPIVGEWTVFGYLAVVIGMLSLAGWLRFERWPAFFCGLLTGGAAFAMWLVVLFLAPLPTSMAAGRDARPMVLASIIMASPPLLTAIVFCLNALGAGTAARRKRRVAPSALLFVAGLAIALGAPLWAQLHIWREVTVTIEMVRQGRPLREIPWSVASLGKVIPLVSYDPLVADYEAEGDPVRRRQLDESYQALTGWTIHDRVHGR
jgi:hypothetical protein